MGYSRALALSAAVTNRVDVGRNRGSRRHFRISSTILPICVLAKAPRVGSQPHCATHIAYTIRRERASPVTPGVRSPRQLHGVLSFANGRIHRNATPAYREKSMPLASGWCTNGSWAGGNCRPRSWDTRGSSTSSTTVTSPSGEAGNRFPDARSLTTPSALKNDWVPIAGSPPRTTAILRRPARTVPPPGLPGVET